MGNTHVARPQRHRTGPLIALIVAVLVLLMLVAIGWIGVRGAMAARALQAATPLVSALESSVMQGDAKTATQAAVQLTAQVDKADRLTSDPVWGVAQHLPWIGPNLAAVRTVSSSAAQLADHGLNPLVSLTGTLNSASFRPVDGALPLAPLVAARPTLATASSAITEASDRVQKIDADATFSLLRGPVRKLQTQLSDVAQLVSSANRAAQLLPGMMGQSGPKTYLLLFLNNAELRATGGIPGSVAHITVDNGKITLDSQVSGGSFGQLKEPALPLTTASQQLYTSRMGTFMQDINFTPQFDQTAQLAQSMWQQRFGETVNGAIAIDPVALSYILAATGPVAVAPGTPFSTTLSSDNAVKTLLSDAYAKFTQPSQQDLFFEAAAGSVFAKIASGGFDPKAMLTQLGKAGSEQRIHVWSADAATQKQLAQTTLAGGLPVSTASDKRFGVYYSDGTGSKMDYYLQSSVALGQVSCSKTGPLYTVEVTLKNAAPTDAATSLPAYVTGGGAYGVPEGTMRTQVTSYAPPGVLFDQISRDGTPFGAKLVKDSGHDAVQFTVDLAPQQSTTVRLVFTGEKVASTLAADVTPQVNPVPVSHRVESCASVLR